MNGIVNGIVNGRQMKEQKIILPGGAGLVGQNLVVRLKARLAPAAAAVKTEAQGAAAGPGAGVGTHNVPPPARRRGGAAPGPLPGLHQHLRIHGDLLLGRGGRHCEALLQAALRHAVGDRLLLLPLASRHGRQGQAGGVQAGGEERRHGGV